MAANRFRLVILRLLLCPNDGYDEQDASRCTCRIPHSALPAPHCRHSAAFPTTTKSSGKSFVLPPCFALPTKCTITHSLSLTWRTDGEAPSSARCSEKIA